VSWSQRLLPGKDSRVHPPTWEFPWVLELHWLTCLFLHQHHNVLNTSPVTDLCKWVADPSNSYLFPGLSLPVLASIYGVKTPSKVCHVHSLTSHDLWECSLMVPFYRWGNWDTKKSSSFAWGPTGSQQQSWEEVLLLLRDVMENARNMGRSHEDRRNWGTEKPV
jgi:hypothetical protein